MPARASWLPRTPFGIVITAIAALICAAMLYLIIAPEFVDFDDYQRIEASGQIATSTARGVLRLRLHDEHGKMQLISCDARGRSGKCLMPAVRAGLKDWDVATVIYLRPPEDKPMAEAVVVQILKGGRPLLDPAERRRVLGGVTER
jgi:hypothetical protein